MLNKENNYFAVARKICQTITLRSLGVFFNTSMPYFSIEKGSCNQLANMANIILIPIISH